MKVHITLAVATALLMIGCDKADEPEPEAVPPQPPAQEQSAAPPTTPPPPLPEENAPKDMPATPLPGQVNDHSTPAFDEGGKPDPTE